MYNVNDHPNQEELNTAIANVLSTNIKTLNTIATAFDVDKKELAKQYKSAFEMFIEENRFTARIVKENGLWYGELYSKNGHIFDQESGWSRYVGPCFTQFGFRTRALHR